MKDNLEKKNDEKKYIRCQWKNYVFVKYILLFFTVEVFSAISFWPYFGPVFSLTASVCLFFLFLLLQRKINTWERIPVLCYFISAVWSVWLSLQLGNKVISLSSEKVIHNIILLISIAGNIFIIIRVFFADFFRKLKADRKRGYDLIPLTLFLLFFFVFLPTELIMKNNDDYLISYGEYIYPNLICFLLLTIILSYIKLCLPFKAGQVLARMEAGLFIACYLQYIFLNGKLGMLDGGVFDYKKEMSSSIVNAVIWLVIIAGFMFLSGKMKEKRISAYVCGGLGIMLVSAFGFNLVKAPAHAFAMTEYDIDVSEQYVVSGNKNIVLFVLDAVDNSYMKEIYQTDRGYFDDFSDYTMYTNTCSVYDLTSTSLPQMLTGSDFNGKSADYGEFYNRLHENGYVIHLYNYESTKDSIDIRGYIDNYIKMDAGSMKYTVDYVSVVNNTVKLSGYILFPYFLKCSVKPENINFTSQVYFAERDGKAVNYIGKRANVSNDDFLKDLSLSVDKNTKGYFIMQHVEGAHSPQEDYIEATYESLNLVKEYMRQLKELGLYDDAVIIITADHGLHDDASPYSFPMASTPVLMIKEADGSRQEMAITDAPVYHTDFLKTILQMADLYTEEDGDRFGMAFHDFSEGEMRTRTWYDTAFHLQEWDYYAYEYTGTTGDLEKAVEEGRYQLVNN